nr:MAG TPA: hypothetical protein [Caudoviricetes sp.]
MLPSLSPIISHTHIIINCKFFILHSEVLNLFSSDSCFYPRLA